MSKINTNIILTVSRPRPGWYILCLGSNFMPLNTSEIHWRHFLDPITDWPPRSMVSSHWTKSNLHFPFPIFWRACDHSHNINRQTARYWFFFSVRLEMIKMYFCSSAPQSVLICSVPLTVPTLALNLFLSLCLCVCVCESDKGFVFCEHLAKP